MGACGMLRRVPPCTPRGPLALLRLALAAAPMVFGCSSGSSGEAGAGGGAAARSSEDWASALRDGSVEAVLRALGQSHATVRRDLGPHRLRYTARFELGDPEGDAPEPALDGPAVSDTSITDELELVWAPAAETDPQGSSRLHLRQSNDKDRGREVVVVDGNVHTSDLHRGWQFYPLETDLHERWLDEAQRAVHDAIELAAPRLRLEPKTSPDGTLAFVLGMSERSDEALRREGAPSRWRAEAELERIAGELVLDAVIGGWRSAKVDVQYALRAADGRMLRGIVRIEGSVEPLSPDAVAIRAPADSRPLAERTRLHAERQELLDGLAAPR